MQSVSEQYSPSNQKVKYYQGMNSYSPTIADQLKFHISPHRMKLLLLLAALASVGSGWQLRQAEEEEHDPKEMFATMDVDGSKYVHIQSKMLN